MVFKGFHKNVTTFHSTVLLVFSSLKADFICLKLVHKEKLMITNISIAGYSLELEFNTVALVFYGTLNKPKTFLFLSFPIQKPYS